MLPVLALGLFLLGAAVASAFTNTYCGVLINQGSWCGDGSDHSYYWNRATYPGSGTVTVCERMLIEDTSTVRQSAACGDNYVARDYGTSGCCYEAEVTHRYSGGARHTVTGQAKA